MKFRNELPADVVKTLTLSVPKKKRQKVTIKKEEEIVAAYKEGKFFKQSSHKGFIAIKELLNH